MGTSGYDLVVALKKGAAWGTALACGAGDGLIISSHGLKKAQPAKLDDQLGVGFPKDLELGAIDVSGPLAFPMRYEGIDLLLALFAGATGGAPDQQDATDAYLQTFPLAANTDGKFGTLAMNDVVGVDEYPSVKVAGLELKGEIGSFVEGSTDLIASSLVTDSVINTLVTMANVTYPDKANRLHFSQMAMRMNTQSGDALDSGDLIYPTSFSLSAKRKVKGTPWVGGSNSIDEPANEDNPEVKLTLKFARHNAASKAYFEDWAASGFKKMDIIFTGGLIEGAYNYKFKIEMPNLGIASVNKPFTKGALPSEIEFMVLGCGVAPTGMTVTEPFLMTSINKRTTDVFA